mgnify:CR=1 FL=1
MTQDEHNQVGQILAKILSENVGNRITTATGNGILGQFLGEIQQMVKQEEKVGEP